MGGTMIYTSKLKVSKLVRDRKVVCSYCDATATLIVRSVNGYLPVCEEKSCPMHGA
jgi:thymidine kinase